MCRLMVSRQPHIDGKIFTQIMKYSDELQLYTRESQPISQK